MFMDKISLHKNNNIYLTFTFKQLQSTFIGFFYVHLIYGLLIVIIVNDMKIQDSSSVMSSNGGMSLSSSSSGKYWCTSSCTSAYSWNNWFSKSGKFEMVI